MTGEKGYHFFATLDWRHWTVTSAFSGDSKTQPISWGPRSSTTGGPGTTTSATSSTRRMSASSPAARCGGAPTTIRFITKAAATTRSAMACVEDNRQSEIGDWVGTQLTYRVRPFFAGDITVGIEGKIDLRAFLTNYDVSPAPVMYLSTSHPDRSFDLIFQDEKKLSRALEGGCGLRVDKSYYEHDFVSPRAALIYQPSAWTYQVPLRPQLSQPQRISALLRRWSCGCGQSQPAPGIGRHAGVRCGA